MLELDAYLVAMLKGALEVDSKEWVIPPPRMIIPSCMDFELLVVPSASYKEDLKFVTLVTTCPSATISVNTNMNRPVSRNIN